MNFEEMSKEDLIEYIKNLNESNNGKYGLIWDKEKEPEQVVVDCDKNIPVLEEVKEKEIDNGGEDNILIEGDNFHALSVLNYTHPESIDVIYIDPPYNTGNKDFIYNDKYVDAEDGYRHSKWLNFMSKRLKLARNLLKEDGVIFISIDDNEQAQLKLLCDNIFGIKNFICNFVWQKNFAPKNDNKYISTSHEYILMYAKFKDLYNRNLLPRSEKNNSSYSNPDDDPRGAWTSGTCLATSFSKSGVFEVIAPNGKKHLPPEGKCWRFSPMKFNELIKKNKIWFGKNGQGVPRIKRFLNEMPNGIVPQTWLKYEDVGSAQDGSKELKIIFNSTVFNFPKPVKLIKFLIDRHVNKKAIVLDFFAGTGTTAQAVLELNNEDGGNRTFILCTNNENNICEEVTYKRLENVLKGYGTHQPLAGSLKYFKTDFVKNEGTRDQLYYDLTEKCVPMLCVKESTFDVIIKNEQYAIYTDKDKKKYTCVYFDTLGNKYDEFWDKVEEIKEEKILYIFSLGNKIEEPRLEKLQNYKIEAIPQRIYSLYRKIVKLSRED